MINVLILLGKLVAEFLFDRRNAGLSGVELFTMVLNGSIVLTPCSLVFENSSFHLRVWISIGSDSLEERQHAVVVALRDWIYLMIMAAGTIDCQAQEGLARGGDDVVESVV